MHNTIVVVLWVLSLYGKRTPDLSNYIYIYIYMIENNKQSQHLNLSSGVGIIQYHQFPISALIFIEENVPLAIIKHFPRLVCRKLIRKMTATQCRQSDRERRNDRKRGNDSIDSTSMACIISAACLSLYLHV